MSVKFPNVKIKLVGMDGNAYSIMARVQSAMRRAKIDQSEIDTYLKEAKAGDYDHLLYITMETVSCDTD